MAMTTITLSGCHSRTTVEMDLTPDETATVERLVEALTSARTDSCDPTIDADIEPGDSDGR